MDDCALLMHCCALPHGYEVAGCGPGALAARLLMAITRRPDAASSSACRRRRRRTRSRRRRRWAFQLLVALAPPAASHRVHGASCSQANQLISPFNEQAKQAVEAAARAEAKAAKGPAAAALEDDSNEARAGAGLAAAPVHRRCCSACLTSTLLASLLLPLCCWRCALLFLTLQETDPTKYYENRLKGVVAAKARGENPYPHKFPVTLRCVHSVVESRLQRRRAMLPKFLLACTDAAAVRARARMCMALRPLTVHGVQQALWQPPPLLHCLPCRRLPEYVDKYSGLEAGQQLTDEKVRLRQQRWQSALALL